jgi:hypothetical protein
MLKCEDAMTGAAPRVMFGVGLAVSRRAPLRHSNAPSPQVSCVQKDVHAHVTLGEVVAQNTTVHGRRRVAVIRRTKLAQWAWASDDFRCRRAPTALPSYSKGMTG